jgi:hypothetical protein
VGTVLLQAQRPVAYYSRKLSVAELNYSVSDIEMLVVRLALRECRCYLEGAKEPFTLVSNCQLRLIWTVPIVPIRHTLSILVHISLERTMLLTPSPGIRRFLHTFALCSFLLTSE